MGCQIIRDVTYAPNRSRKCADCRVEFWPVKANYKICNDCREAERPEKYDACVRCGKHFRPAPELNGTCFSCVQRTWEIRRQYVQTLKENRKPLEKS